MSEADNVQKIQIPQGTDWLTVTTAKAKTYANDLVSNTARLKDPKYCNLIYGVFQGSEGDYTFHQRSAIEQMAMTTRVVEVGRQPPASADEHASWFLDSILSGNSAEARNSVLAKRYFGYEPGDMYGAVQKMAVARGLNTIAVKSVCETFSDMSQVVEHHIPYLPNGQRANIDIVFSSKKSTPKKEQSQNNETIRIGDPLPEHYAKPLEEIRQNAPQGFNEQATKLAYYFHALDQNRSLVDEHGNSLQEDVNHLADEIADLPSIHMVYVFDSLAKSQQEHQQQEKGSSSSHIKRRRAFDSIPPEEALPQWITSRETPDKLTPKTGGIPQAAKFYNEYAPKHGEGKDLTHGRYFFYDKSMCPPPGEAPVDIFKGYIENDVPESQMTALFEDLAELKIHPSSSKLFEGDRIVLYWDTYLSDDLSSKLQQAFEKHHVQYRGFGQDSMQVNIEKDGKWKFNVRSSNDQSRGEAGGGAEFHDAEYTPQRFFELYLQQMMRHCRNPLDPYRMSFVPVNGESDNLQNQDKLKTKLEEIEKRGLDVAWYKGGVPFLFR